MLDASLLSYSWFQVCPTSQGRRAQAEGGDPGRDAPRPRCGKRPASGWPRHPLHDGPADEAQEDWDHGQVAERDQQGECCWNDVVAKVFSGVGLRFCVNNVQVLVLLDWCSGSRVWTLDIGTVGHKFKLYWKLTKYLLQGRDRIGSAYRIGQSVPPTYEPILAGCIVHLYVSLSLSSYTSRLRSLPFTCYLLLSYINERKRTIVASM